MSVITRMERKVPIIIPKLNFLLKRLPLHQLKRKEVEDYLARQMAGFRGEQSMNYFYRYLPQDQIEFLHNIRIIHQDYYFQMDTLIITPHFILILEIKNIAGHLYFDNLFSQVIRIHDGKKESFDDPIQQVERQAFHLSEVLKNKKVPFIPIETLVVVTNPKTLVESAPGHTDAIHRVIKSPDLKKRFDLLTNKHTKEVLSKMEIKKMKRLLNKLHTPYDPDVCSLFQIDKSELMKGVFCPSCELILNRTKRSWYCTNCDQHFKKAHIQAIKDYAVLISDHITNKDFKEFLNLPSSSISYHLLRALNLPYTGSTKDRTYLLHSLIDDLYSS
ncbi:nuclease-related domain-containing protein [Fictibacillus phosphorivorans]|uniref:nuclease-related domain-containing protein n=1 Tax=Fictibacillus phosphorivorans TaxID=1221500 RepID=UPI00203BE8B1|nr:nuclease-related domain-containing protein [Fictibacillus phosphorivorans]MCM3720063.1 NERD domain-containing protein [Fictibacillus phosphorivorans]MCM3777738.1 NERD domain-containing protein [Fictibacillus phosphorivorans]